MFATALVHTSYGLNVWDVNRALTPLFLPGGVPLTLLLRGLAGQLRGGELDEEVSGSADEGLVRQVLWDLGEEVVHRGHVTLTLQDLRLPVQHDLHTLK